MAKERYRVVRTSMFTKRTQARWLVFDMKDYLAYSEMGVDIQRAMPYLEPWEREFIMTGVTKEEWDEHMGKPDDDDEDDDQSSQDTGHN